MAKYKTIIGRAEGIDFPARNLLNIPAKTDTGAYLSAIHATDIKVVKSKNGKKVLRFNLLNDHGSYPGGREIEVKNFEKRVVSNSFGAKQNRYVVNFKVKIAGKEFRTPFSLADRSKKVFPILLGRRLINKRFVVDTDISHINKTELKYKFKDWLLKDDLVDDEETME